MTQKLAKQLLSSRRYTERATLKRLGGQRCSCPCRHSDPQKEGISQAWKFSLRSKGLKSHFGHSLPWVLVPGRWAPISSSFENPHLTPELSKSMKISSKRAREIKEAKTPSLKYPYTNTLSYTQHRGRSLKSTWATCEDLLANSKTCAEGKGIYRNFLRKWKL